MNKVEVTGRVYNPQVRTSLAGKSITRFGLSIYVGKDKDGKSKYGFIDCKYFGNLVTDDKLKDVTGRLSVDSWEKDGKKFSKPEIIVDTITTSTMFEDKKESEEKQETPKDDGGWDAETNSFNDDIPFN